jgi:hypothetical protein
LIVWLASWPRSGNTLLRLIIERCFDIPTYSVYPERKLTWLFGERSNSLGEKWCSEKHLELKNSEELYCIKTHQIIEDDSPILYIARDGRDACTSLGRFWGLPVRRIITANKIKIGAVSIGSWSEHVQYYLPKLKANPGLIIKYEYMLTSPDRVAEKISSFMQTETRCKFSNDFAELHKKEPKMFRGGRIGDWLGEFGSEDSDLFWRRHGKAMRLLGYA